MFDHFTLGKTHLDAVGDPELGPERREGDVGGEAILPQALWYGAHETMYAEVAVHTWRCDNKSHI